MSAHTVEITPPGTDRLRSSSEERSHFFSSETINKFPSTISTFPPRPHTSSPTDEMLSPCSRRLLGKKTFLRTISQPMPLDIKGNPPKFVLNDFIPYSPCESYEIILGSSSSSRKAVLDAAGWTYRQISPDIDEKAIRSENPLEMPLLIARAKADAILALLTAEDCQEDVMIITADQIVLFEDTVREKPENRQEAVRFLSSYSQKPVSTISAVVATHFRSKQQAGNVDVSKVHWNVISPEVVDKVVTKGEIFSSAGGFKIEDEDLFPLVEKIEGTVDSVFGMPIKLTESLIAQVIAALKCASIGLDTMDNSDASASSNAK